MTLERGERLNNRYRIVEVLGQGGMGAVYRAVDENLGVEVAVKENLFLTDEYARQFKREALILAGLRHPNLPRVGDHFEIERQGQYLVMDFIEGEDLRQRMERTGALSEEDVVLIGAAMCDALAYLHTRRPPIVHRDLKPGNVKINPEGQIVLVDFGLAKVMDDAQATSTGARAMTPGYSPPEQYGTARTDPRTDIYSLSATLYAALTGVIPEDGLARATGNANLTPLRKINSKVSRKLANVIERGLAIHPDDRYQTAEEFKSALLDAHIEARNSMRREITVAPPPAPEIVVAEDGNSNGKGSNPPPAARPLALAPLGASSDPVYIPARPWRSGTNWLALFLLVLILGTGALLMTNPSLVAQSPLIALMRTPTATVMSSATPTDEIGSQETPCVGANCAIISGLDPNRLATPTKTAAATSTPTITPTKTLSPTLTVTPIGGGMGEIVFASNRTGIPQLWTMDANGGKLFQVTSLPDGACQPDWSPDGIRIVFISPCPGKRDIYERSNLFIINRDGSRLLALPKSPEGDFEPAWSPDGNRIAYTSLKNNQPRIFVLNLVDNSVMEISKTVFGDRQPSWSPSGTQLAFVRIRNSPEIWVVSDTGQNEFKFTLSGSIADNWPVWSPDNRFIFYCQGALEKGVPWLTAQRYEDRGKMKEFRVPGEDLPQVGPVNKPSISPDNMWIVYESWPDGINHDIYRMTISGAGPVRLTTDPGLDFDPKWLLNMLKP
ncbi:MAG TPA: protein kinase [Anaerolineaceae bacterium]|nr:protein kinase [Anaerolineaceae bacterium]